MNYRIFTFLVFFTMLMPIGAHKAAASTLSPVPQQADDYASAGGYDWNAQYVTPHIPQGKSWEDKHFREAMLRGRKEKEYYTLVNNENKEVSESKLIEYCKAHRFLAGSHTKTKNLKKFGTTVQTVEEFYFLPEDMVLFYVYECCGDYLSGKNLTQKGAVQYYLTDNKRFVLLPDAFWSGTVVGGKVEGSGSGIIEQVRGSYLFFSGTFHQGVPCGVVEYRLVNTGWQNWWMTTEQARANKKDGGSPSLKINVDELNGNAALFRFQSDSKYGILEMSNDIITITLEPSLKEQDVKSKFHNGKVKVIQDKKEVYVDRFGKFIDYSEGEKQLMADAKAKEERERAEAERQRRLAEEEAAEERRQAAIFEAELTKRIEANKNTRLWSQGCRLAYRYPNKQEYIIATLEQWSDDRSRVKVRIVSSPSSVSTYKGDLLSKGNTMWVSARNEGWHLAFDEELAIALGDDHSANINCLACNGRGTIPCGNCDGTGQVERWSYGSKYYDTCGACHGKGSRKCKHCNGSGRYR
ncbi:MAG: zinc finger-like domain-containing protein [Bacteroidales bacterium]|nr:zinc finger-like domain-containing protein [Bacteroidales bacterium]